MVSRTARMTGACVKRREPLAEIYQIKGASECALGVGATDEECAFAQVLDPCLPGETRPAASFKHAFVRQGLKVGLELERGAGLQSPSSWPCSGH